MFRYTRDDVDKLVEGTIPQRRVLDLAPGIGNVVGVDGREHLTKIIENSLEYWKLFGMLETLWDIEYLLWIVNISRSVPCIISNISVTCLLLIARKERKHVVVQPWLWRLSWTKSYLKHHDNSSKEAQYIQALYWPTWRTGCTDHWRYTVRR